jgi:ABC-type transport system involved in cytochrome bd biosynthesis fused ATPase/permease subunit
MVNAVMNNPTKGLESAIPAAVATCIAAVMLNGAEHIDSTLAVGIAWIALVTSLILPPAKGESFVANITSATKL